MFHILTSLNPRTYLTINHQDQCLHKREHDRKINLISNHILQAIILKVLIYNVINIVRP